MGRKAKGHFYFEKGIIKMRATAFTSGQHDQQTKKCGEKSTKNEEAGPVKSWWLERNYWRPSHQMDPDEEYEMVAEKKSSHQNWWLQQLRLGDSY
ncbi:MAG: hypothetical protein QM762_11460 [Chryseolinea sp.]